MAKKAIQDSTGLSSVFDLIKSFDDSAEIISNSAYSNIKEWIPSGNYILNACMSGDLFKGCPSGRTISLIGEEGTGKSYLQVSFCREAQKMGYSPVILDSEGAIDAQFVSRLGVDPKNCIIKQVNTIFETNNFISNLCKSLQEQEEKYGTHQKVFLVLDSLGNLTSSKERDDTQAGEQKRDMTKAQEIRALFRVNQVPLSKLQIPLIVVGHVYASQDSFHPGPQQSGGGGIKYNSSITLLLSTRKLEDKANDAAAISKNTASTQTKNGILVSVTPKKSRFCVPNKVSFQIPFFKAPNPYIGLEQYLNWENAGICRGNVLDEKAFAKLSPGDQAKCHEFENEEQKLYCQPKDTARGMAVKHLGRQVSFVEFFSDIVFTDEFLHEINENVIHPIFQLPSRDAFDDIKDVEESLGIETEE